VRVLAHTTCLNPPAGLVSWWPGDGDATDIIGGNDGALGGNAGFDTGFVGEAFGFSGGAVSLSTQPPLAEGFTIDAWVNFDDTNFDTDQRIFGNNQGFLRKNVVGEGNGFAVFVRLDDGSVEPRAQSTTVPVAGTWTHVAGTWDGTTLKIYVNGQLEDTSSRPGSLTTTTVQAQIGRGEQIFLANSSFLRWYRRGRDLQPCSPRLKYPSHLRSRQRRKVPTLICCRQSSSIEWLFRTGAT